MTDRILGVAQDMNRDVATLARGIANVYLSHYGLTTDTWVAGFSRDAGEARRRRAAQVQRGLDRGASRITLHRNLTLGGPR